MICLSRKAGENLVVNGPAIIRFTEVRKTGVVRFVVECPDSTDVWRGELRPGEIIADQIRASMREEAEAA